MKQSSETHRKPRLAHTFHHKFTQKTTVGPRKAKMRSTIPQTPRGKLNENPTLGELSGKKNQRSTQSSSISRWGRNFHERLGRTKSAASGG